jgi:hypothetical protein
VAEVCEAVLPVEVDLLVLSAAGARLGAVRLEVARLEAGDSPLRAVDSAVTVFSFAVAIASSLVVDSGFMAGGTRGGGTTRGGGIIPLIIRTTLMAILMAIPTRPTAATPTTG